MKLRALILTALVALLLAAPAGPALADAAVPAAMPASCQDLAAYKARLGRFAVRDLGRANLALIASGRNPSTFTPSELRQMSAGLDRFHATLIRMERKGQVPAVAADYHAAATELTGLVSAGLNAMATSGPFGLIPYGDALEAAAAHMDQANAAGRATCGTDWPWGDDDGLIGGSSL